MSRINFTQEEYDRLLGHYMAMMEVDAHRMQGCKAHLANMMSTDLKTFWPRDINHMLDNLQQKGLIGHHHIPLIKIKQGEKQSRIALQQDLLLRNQKLPPNHYIVSDEAVSVLAIGDLHVDPSLSNERMKWIGRLAAERQPEHIVQIGDFLNLSSLSGHEKPGTLAYSQKPSFKEDDLPCFIEALKFFQDELPKKYKPRKHVTLGNHCFRMERFQNEHPETNGIFTHMVYSQFEKYGWTYSPYGASYFVSGVEFTHVPFNLMGKPQAITEIAKSAVNDLVYGHTHQKGELRIAKRGHTVTVVNLGCALPYGHIEAYAKHSLNAWSYGVYILTIDGGRIRDTEFLSMRLLEEKYG
jgi:hypothetical protein